MNGQCQSAALDELFGNPASCCRRYQTAHILFHSLAQQVTQLADKSILNKCNKNNSNGNGEKTLKLIIMINLHISFISSRCSNYDRNPCNE